MTLNSSLAEEHLLTTLNILHDLVESLDGANSK